MCIIKIILKKIFIIYNIIHKLQIINIIICDQRFIINDIKIKAKGTKIQVWNGLAKHTSGGLVKSDLVKNKRGKIVSKKQQAAGKRAFAKNKLMPKTKAELDILRRNNKPGIQ